MRNLYLTRVVTGDEGTFGTLQWEDDSVPFALTCEDPWRENRVGESCIPIGRYRCRAHNSPSKGRCALVTDVPGRTHILFHVGNDMDDTRGCILVAEKYGRLGELGAVLASRAGFTEFMETVEQVQEFELIVAWGPFAVQ